MMKILVGCAALTMFAGCAMAPPKAKVQRVRVAELQEVNQDTTLDPSKTYICNEEAKTGSHYRTSVCRSQKQQEEQRRAAQDALTRMSMQPMAR